MDFEAKVAKYIGFQGAGMRRVLWSSEQELGWDGTTCVVPQSQSRPGLFLFSVLGRDRDAVRKWGVGVLRESVFC